MIIEINHNNILIRDEPSTLRLEDKSQLSFWNFTPISLSEYQAPLEEQLFLKVLRYLDKEGKIYKLGAKAKLIFEKLESKNYTFNLLRQKASAYKDGKFDKLDFEKFKEFTFNYIKRPLKTHQLKAAYHLYLLGNAANFSVPGSGKTSVVLSVYEKLRIEKKVNTLFVVGPPSCFGPWKTEFVQTLGRKPRSTILSGRNKNERKSQYYNMEKGGPELYLTTFQSFLYDQDEVEYFFTQRNSKIFLVIDEAHYIKQINGNWASAILKQSRKVNYRCVLTGTPMPKSYTDIYNLFDFLWPTHNPLSSRDKSLIKHNEQTGNSAAAKVILDEKIGSLFYRVRKSDLNLSSPNFISPEVIAMNHYERIIYDAIYKKIKDYSKNDYLGNITLINRLERGRIMRLRQATSYVKLLTTAIDNYEEYVFENALDLKRIIKSYDSLEMPAKMIHLLRKVKKLINNNQKIVIWSNFIETIKLIERHLKEKGHYCKKIFGNTPIEGGALQAEETREKIRDEFVDPLSNLNILIANPAACSESISLHKTCHHAIYYDLSYNCAQYLQSLDRIHRVGGSELIKPNYHFLQYTNTIDIDIKQNLDRKTRKMNDIFEQEFPIYSLDMFDEDDDLEAYNRLFHKNK